MRIFTDFTAQVIELINSGHIGVIPTDTVYGLVAKLLDREAVERILAIKNRPIHKPMGTILISDASQIKGIVSSEDELIKAEYYWPGPTSVVLRVHDTLGYAHKGMGSLAFRIPASKDLQKLLVQTGPLATTSANLAGHPTVSTIQKAINIFSGGVDFFVDGGDRASSSSSKIIKLNNNQVEVLRKA